MEGQSDQVSSVVEEVIETNNTGIVDDVTDENSPIIDATELEDVLATLNDVQISTSNILAEDPKQIQDEKVVVAPKTEVFQDHSKIKFNNTKTEMAGGDDKHKAQTQEVKKSKDKKSKKAVASSIEALTNSIKSLPLEQQVTTLLAKHAETVEDNKQLQKTCKSSERQALISQKERDQIEADHAKAILTKSRLESVCRELQRQNKTIKDENATRLREEEERRKEVSNKFNTTLSEISNLMQENTDKNTKLRDENQEMAAWLKDLVKQYESREEQVEKILKQRELQVQLAEAKLAKVQMDFTEDKEKLLLEKKGHLEELQEYQQKATQMSMVEIQLRTQLNSYTEKYEEFQGTLDKSNQIFGSFKKEMDDMTKKIKKLERETKSWKDRWEGANKALLDMVNERSSMEKNLETVTKQNTKLQNLCRAFQQQIQELRSSSTSKTDVEELSNGIADVNLTDVTSEGVNEVTANIPHGQNSEAVENQSSSGDQHKIEADNIQVENSEDVSVENKNKSTTLINIEDSHNDTDNSNKIIQTEDIKDSKEVAEITNIEYSKVEAVTEITNIEYAKVEAVAEITNIEYSKALPEIETNNEKDEPILDTSVDILTITDFTDDETTTDVDEKKETVSGMDDVD